MRIIQWHGWLLRGSGSNIYAARVTERFRRAGHHVVLMCQERHPERLPFVDGWGTVGVDGVSEIHRTHVPPSSGTTIMLRPEIGPVLPVFVVDEYEGFDVVKSFVDLSDTELDRYIRANVEAMRAAVLWHDPDAVIAGHAIPGGIVASRALDRPYVVKVHGSELEYTIRHQDRYVRLAAEALLGARAVVGPSQDVLDRTAELVPDSRPLFRVVAPGVDLDVFKPRERDEALEEAASQIEADGASTTGRLENLGERVAHAVARRDEQALHDLALSYDQDASDAGAAARLRGLEGYAGPMAGFLGKLIPQKGPHLLLQTLALMPELRGLVIGFGQFREWFAALAYALEAGDPDAVRWVCRSAGLELELSEREIRSSPGLEERLTFTGRLDHRHAPAAIAAMDVLVVPSILSEAFGMVVIEGAASGVLPLVARHSGLAEIAAELEDAVGHTGLFSFSPGLGAVRRLAEGLSQLLSMDDGERRELRRSLRAHAEATWSWDGTARSLLEVAT